MSKGKKSPKMPCSEKNGKVIQNPHVDLDQHQKSIRSPLADAYQVWWTSVSVFVSYHARRITDRQNEQSHYSTSLDGVTTTTSNNNKTLCTHQISVC